MARGHRRTSGIRIAGASLALVGAGLTITGVASASIVDGPNDSTTVPGTAYATGTPDVSVSVGLLGGGDGNGGGNGNGGDNGNGGADGGGSSTATPSGGSSSTASSTPSTSTTASSGASASVSASPSSAGGASGGGTGGSMTQAPGRTQLAETGSSDKTPMILAGGFTFVLGGAVFRFGPRAASARKH
ncbi:hypothetical protein [Streptacidiphilus anmyonensis]|uniref:hypothetical protein n=1 Tax=Streptacidiphilus anmyonensis TaxID=405782 RepID=UPI0006941433|nr:hypothetical protein [Streptacidiphilus anmyonensis]